MLTAETAIQSIRGAFGSHPGYRALHAKGVVCEGTFTATPGAAALTRAAHMQGRLTKTVVRFSNGSGDPRAPDHAIDLRGMATSFRLAGDSWTDIVAQTAPRFPTRTAEQFLELLEALAPGPAKLWRLPLFLRRHPEVAKALPGLLQASRPPRSYATCTYHAIHAFAWTAGDGRRRHVRYRWVPLAGVARLSLRELWGCSADYLQEELILRLARGPVRFMLELQVAADGDDVDHPVTAWPSTRPTVDAGSLEITAIVGADAALDDIAFDPTRLTDGIAATRDPILAFRPCVYELSAKQRSAAVIGGGRDTNREQRGLSGADPHGGEHVEAAIGLVTPRL